MGKRKDERNVTVTSNGNTYSDCLRMTVDETDILVTKTNRQYYYARDIGLVKFVESMEYTEGGDVGPRKTAHVEMDLVEFSIKK